MRKLQTLIYLLLLSTTSVFSQKIILNGYIFEEFNRSFFIRSKVTVLGVTGICTGETVSNMSGHLDVICKKKGILTKI